MRRRFIRLLSGLSLALWLVISVVWLVTSTISGVELEWRTRDAMRLARTDHKLLLSNGNLQIQTLVWNQTPQTPAEANQWRQGLSRPRRRAFPVEWAWVSPDRAVHGPTPKLTAVPPPRSLWQRLGFSDESWQGQTTPDFFATHRVRAVPLWAPWLVTALPALPAVPRLLRYLRNVGLMRRFTSRPGFPVRPADSRSAAAPIEGDH